ncbi:hypothetical protein [Arthrobacter mobilis]|uniref:Uncharacterized protein n=1 Tax=Arthrobacter mobilis TaxID=2724944 RepID=A0A7X6K726_9MICC|nr:hypothetical protein [Arthrobacter mobilis]NKX56350.1 hypothetical protein [Arthrobacter mobilis]
MYRIDTGHYLKNGAILINVSWPYLREDTVLTGAPQFRALVIIPASPTQFMRGSKWASR